MVSHRKTDETTDRFKKQLSIIQWYENTLLILTRLGGTGGSRRWKGGGMPSTVVQAYNGGVGHSSEWATGAEHLVRGKAPMKLKAVRQLCRISA